MSMKVLTNQERMVIGMEENGTKKNSKKGGKTTMKRTRIDDKVFIKTWQTNDSASTIAKKLGLSVTQVHAKAAVLRKHKVALKSLPMGRPERDYSGLIDLAKSLA